MKLFLKLLLFYFITWHGQSQNYFVLLGNNFPSLTGQSLMYSLLTSLSPASSQLRPGCQADRQLAQNWVTHVGHVTGT